MQKSRKRSATDELPFQEPAGRQVAAFCRHLQNVNKRFKAHVQGNMSQCYEKACVQYLEYVQGLRQKYPAVKLEDAVKGDLSGDAKKSYKVQSEGGEMGVRGSRGLLTWKEYWKNWIWVKEQDLGFVLG